MQLGSAESNVWADVFVDGVNYPAYYDSSQNANACISFVTANTGGSANAVDQNNVLGKDGNNVSAENDNGAPQGIMYTSIRCKDILSKVRTADEAGNLSWPQNRYLNSTIKTYLIGT